MAIHGGPSPSPFPQPSSAPERMLAFMYKSVLLLFLCHSYLSWTSPIHRAGGCVGSLLFVVIETIWTTIAHEDAVSGNVTIRMPEGLGHSSFAQFWANIIFTPMLIFGYRFLVSNALLRILLFPINVWCLEIVEGYLIMFLFGRNVAWEYKGCDTFFHGNIKIQYLLPWIGLGLLVESFFEPLLMPAAEALSRNGESGLCFIFLVATVLTLSFSPRLGIDGIIKSFKGHTFRS